MATTGEIAASLYGGYYESYWNSSWSSAAYQGEYSTYGQRIGSIRTNLGTTVKGTEISQVVFTMTFSASGLGSWYSKTIKFYQATKQTLTTSEVPSTYVGSLLGSFKTGAHSNTVSITFNSSTNASLFANLKTYLEAGNTHIIMYNDDATRDSTYNGYTTNYLAMTACKINVTYTPKYTLTLGKGTGIASVSGGGTYVTGTTVTASATPSTGYNFTKWTTGSSASSTSKSTANPYSFALTANTTLYAQATLKTYAITYNANGGSGTTASGTKTHGTSYTVAANGFTAPASKSASYTITLNGNGGTSPSAKACIRKTTYSFANWTLNSTSGTAYAAGAAYTTNAAATFYAKWSSSTSGTVVLGNTTRNSTTANGYTVTFNSNGGTSTKTTQTQTNTISYTFGGWSKSASGAVDYNATSAYAFSANTTLYAVWNSSTSNGSVTLPTAAQCTRSGHTLLGWATSSTATSAQYNPGASYTPTAATTLYAVWKPWTCTVVYNKNNTAASGSMSNSTHAAGASSFLSPNAFSLSGYSFAGWSTSSDGAVVYANESAVPDSVITSDGVTINLYAIWSQNSPWTLSMVHIKIGDSWQMF